LTGIDELKSNLKSIYERKRAAAYAISLEFAQMAWNYFQTQQAARPATPGKYWNNQTAQAAARVFADAFMDSKTVGWFIAHGVDYGVYLELANDREHESLRPIIQRYAGRYLERIKSLYAD
jgi:hypothetical protein